MEALSPRMQPLAAFDTRARGGAQGGAQRHAADDARGYVVTAAGGCARQPHADVVSRYFAPRMGIDEDPATASSSCGLAP